MNKFPRFGHTNAYSANLYLRLLLMPRNIQNAAPSRVLSHSLCTAFAESREYAQLQAQYHDGTTERSQLALTSRKALKLAQRLTTSRVIAPNAFWDGQPGTMARSGFAATRLASGGGPWQDFPLNLRPNLLLRDFQIVRALKI